MGCAGYELENELDVDEATEAVEEEEEEDRMEGGGSWSRAAKGSSALSLPIAGVRTPHRLPRPAALCPRRHSAGIRRLNGFCRRLLLLAGPVSSNDERVYFLSHSAVDEAAAVSLHVRKIILFYV